jgi:hypothetical protein
VSDQPPYVVSVAFRRVARAKVVYHLVEPLLHDQPVDLSAYNIELNGQPLVVVLGYPPTPEVHAALERILKPGRPATVPELALAKLFTRSLSQWAEGPWSAYHHQPGKVLPVEEE